MLNGWIDVKETVPDSEKDVLVLIKNSYGKHNITIAQHINNKEKSTEDYGWQEFEGDTEYDEDKDCFWVPECWYESNFVEDNANWIIDSYHGEVIAWQNLPNKLCQ